MSLKMSLLDRIQIETLQNDLGRFLAMYTTHNRILPIKFFLKLNSHLDIELSINRSDEQNV